VAGLDEYADEETVTRVLEECGRRCQSPSFVGKASKIYEASESVDEFLDELGKIFDGLHREGNDVYVVYPKCYCPNVNKIPPGEISATYCRCSQGWTKELFEGALARQVDVIMERSILSGDDQCRFRVVV
jgi:predicted hydrocarbon binding protein